MTHAEIGDRAMALADSSQPSPRKFDEWENEGGALASRKTPHIDRLVILDRTDGSKIACRLSSIHLLAERGNGSVLHFGSSFQVNVSQSFDEIVELLNSQP